MFTEFLFSNLDAFIYQRKAGTNNAVKNKQ